MPSRKTSKESRERKKFKESRRRRKSKLKIKESRNIPKRSTLKESRDREKEHKIKYFDKIPTISLSRAGGHWIGGLVPKIKKYIPKHYKIVGYLGGGAHGSAYLLSGPNLVPQALKVVAINSKYKSSSESAFIHEYNMQLKFANAGIAPFPLEIGVFDQEDPHYSHQFGIVRMERVGGIIKSLLENHRFSVQEMKHLINEIERVLKIMCNVGLIHGDFHLDNIGYNLNQTSEQFTIQVFDFGLSCCVKKRAKCDVKLELLTLLTDAQKNSPIEIYRRNMSTFIPGIIKLMKKFGIGGADISNAKRALKDRKIFYEDRIFEPDL